MGAGTIRPLLVPMAVLALVAVGACRAGDEPEATGNTVRTEPPTSLPAPTTTTEEASFAIPDDPARMDVAYANRVMAALERVQGDLVRRIVATKKFEFEDLAPVRAVFADGAFESQAKGYADLVARPDSDWKHPPGDNTVVVQRVVAATRECLYLEATVDVSPTVAGSPPARRTFIWLKAKDPAADPKQINPTPWSVVGEDDGGASPCT